MNYWIFTATQHKIEGNTYSPEEIVKQRLADQFWGLGERTPNRRYLKKGDQIIYYLGNPIKSFAASATLSSDSFILTEEQKKKYSHDKEIYKSDFGVLLENIQLWDHYHPVNDLVANLKFIENKEIWGSYFQGGVRQITEDDYRIITENITYTNIQPQRTADTIVSESQFALEAHLEEFIDNNWKHINFGGELEKYKIEVFYRNYAGDADIKLLWARPRRSGACRFSGRRRSNCL